jgi:hypothetical protein
MLQDNERSFFKSSKKKFRERDYGLDYYDPNEMYQEGYSMPFLGKGFDRIEAFHNFLSNAA